MAAQNNQGLFFHVYRENFKEKIFIDNQDYDVFLNFLKDYFSENNTESTKKTFTINGHTYLGIPHQHQKFINQIELLAYKLEPNRFDLVIKEIVPSTLTKFIRALSTRYALYFNKRHNRVGTLFKDTYQSYQINDQKVLLHLIRDLHSHFSHKDGVPDYYHSSYPEYLGQRESNWIKSEKINKEFTSLPKSTPRIPEIILAIIILFLFSAYGLRNIYIFKTKSNNLAKSVKLPSSQVAGIQDTISDTKNIQPEQFPTEVPNEEQKISETTDQNPEIKTYVVIKITDGLEQVNLLKEPKEESEVIGQASDGEKFELISEHPGYYEIRLDDNQNAFISTSYSEIVKEF